MSEFARLDVNSRRVSDAVYIRGLPWQIKALSRAFSGQLSMYLRCNNDNFEYNWSCTASATFRIVSQEEGKEDYADEIGRQIFTTENKGFGLNFFIPFEKLMDPKNGWYDAKNDTVILSAEVKAEELIGVE
uniref:MATH domain-containing protein n=1 Tax=Globodera rostochiensis TaxID=31243 RepID=A0A914HIF4_GLORO